MARLKKEMLSVRKDRNSMAHPCDSQLKEFTKHEVLSAARTLKIKALETALPLVFEKIVARFGP